MIVKAAIAGAAFGIGLGLTSNVSGVVLALYGAAGALIVSGGFGAVRWYRRKRRSGSPAPDGR